MAKVQPLQVAKRHVLEAKNLPPVKRVALELLEHLAASVKGTPSETCEFTGDVVNFILGDAVSASLPRVLHNVCTLIAVRILSRQILFGYDALPTDNGWGVRAASLACAANLASPLIDPAGRFVADLLTAQVVSPLLTCPCP